MSIRRLADQQGKKIFLNSSYHVGHCELDIVY